MATKRRTDYRVDEDALKRMMAGDVTALEETAAPAETPEIKPSLSRERQEKKTSADSPKQQTRKFPDEASGADEYRLRFLEAKLTGTRRQTYIHDSLYIVIRFHRKADHDIHAHLTDAGSRTQINGV